MERGKRKFISRTLPLLLPLAGEENTPPKRKTEKSRTNW
jgi:hypothetical protein